MSSDNRNIPVAIRDFSDCFIGNKILYYDTIDSTNGEAKRCQDFPDGTVFVAEKQMGGRGRLGRIWESDENGLWFSILLKPNINPETVSQITLIAGLAVSNVITNSKIKWPNDIVLGSKKICGILTEMSTESNKVKFVVLGIGVNVNTEKFSDEIKDIATSLYRETGLIYSKNELLTQICNEFERKYLLFMENGFSACVDEYKKKCATLGKEVIIKSSSGDYTAFAEDIDASGELIIRTDDGKTKILSGEVSVRGIFGYI